MTNPVAGLRTVGDRVAELRSRRGIKNPAALTRLLEERGFSVRRQTIAALERNKIDQPRQPLVNALAEVLEVTPEYLLHGERRGEHPFNEEVRGLLPDLSEQQQAQLLYLANEMAKETRARRRDELSEQEAELVRLFREASPDAQAMTLGGLRSDTGAPQPTQSRRSAPRTSREQSA